MSMSTYEIVIGMDGATKVLYPTLVKAEEALADKRHGEHCQIAAVVPYDEAVKIVNGIKTRKRTLYVAASQWCPSRQPEGKGYRASAHAQVTRGGLLRYMENAYDKKLREVCMVQVSLYSNCAFIGCIV